MWNLKMLYEKVWVLGDIVVIFRTVIGAGHSNFLPDIRFDHSNHLNVA